MPDLSSAVRSKKQQYNCWQLLDAISQQLPVLMLADGMLDRDGAPKPGAVWNSLPWRV